ncbi:MAG: hypothetical protein WCS74_00070 [Dehalococcoidales bacterium]
MSRIILAVAMLALHIPLLNTQAATAPPQNQPVLNWNRVDIPSEESLIAPGSDVLQLLSTQDSKLYSVVHDDDCRLYFSGNGGSDWERFALLEEDFVELVECSGKTEILYYASSSSVFRSQDGGLTFEILPHLPGVDGENSYITAVSAAIVGGQEMAAVAVASTSSAGTGGVFLTAPNEFLSRWHDSGLKSLEAYEVGFIPGYTQELALVAAGVCEGELVVKTMLGNAGWGNTWADGVFPAGSQSWAGLEGVSLVFSGDFSTNPPVIIAGLNAEEGGLYRVELGDASDISRVYRLKESFDAISSLDAGNSGTILAGSASGGEAYFSLDRGSTWSQSSSLLAGEVVTSCLVVSEGFYLATSGAESAISFSADGYNYQQIGFVDTRIDALLDFAVSADYARCDTIYLLTWGGGSSLWRSTDGANSWTRCLYYPAGAGVIDKVKLSPGYWDTHKLMYLAGESTDGPCVWKSDDGGTSYIAMDCPHPIDCWEITGDGEFLVGSFDGSNGVVLGTQNGGLSYRTTIIGEAPVCSLDVSSGGAVLAGDTAGSAWISSDYGEGFSVLPGLDETGGSAFVAFDDSFEQTGQLFVTSDSPGEGVYSGKVSEEVTWKRLDDENDSSGCRFRFLVTRENGLVYAVDSQPLNHEAGRGQVLRFLNARRGAVIADVITQGLEEGCCLEKMTAVNNSLWAMDIYNNRLLCYTDTLAQPPELLNPVDGEGSAGTPEDGLVRGITLKWGIMPGAGAYHWQVCDTPSFSGVREDMEGITPDAEVELPALDGQTAYFWRVKAAKPVSSPWSAPAGFTTSVPTFVVAPELEKPLPGEKDVSARPIFQWEKIEKASCYELVVDTRPNFDDPVIMRIGRQALNANAWQADESLEHETGYFWKVRAVDAGGVSEWSAVGSFVTTSEPVVPGEPVPEQPVTTITLPVTTTVNMRDVTTVVPTFKVPGQTIIITQIPGDVYPPAKMQIPQWGFVIIALMGLVLFLLIVLLGVLLIRKT